MKQLIGKMKSQQPFIFILILSHLMSCTHWKALNKPYKEQLEKEKPKTIEVESIYGRKIKLKNPHLDGNNLLGIYERDDPITFQIKSDTIRVSMDEIKQIKKETVNPIVVAGLTTILVVMYIIGPDLIWAISFELNR